MLTKLTRRQYGLTAALCGLTAVGIYLFMIQVTLAHLQTISGMVPFDMRPFGYSPEEAARLLAALEDTGRAYYLLGWPQLPDTLVRASSIASSLKAFSTTMATLITIFIAANWATRKYLPARLIDGS